MFATISFFSFFEPTGVLGLYKNHTKDKLSGSMHRILNNPFLHNLPQFMGEELTKKGSTFLSF